MTSITPDIPPPTPLEQLLRREDLWRGDSQRFASRSVVDTGFDLLNSVLLGRGWPTGTLIEFCQEGWQAECQLLLPALREGSGLIVLLSPPAMPFAQAFLKAGIDLDRLVVVEASDASTFLKSFAELSRADACDAVLAWQPKEILTYTQWRKCLLAASEGCGLYVAFRPGAHQQLNSPASLRLHNHLVPAGLEVTVFKQKGQLKSIRPVTIELPVEWQEATAYHLLDEGHSHPGTGRLAPRRLATVTPIREQS